MGHEAQDGEDGKPCHKAGAAVEEAEGDAVPAVGGEVETGGSERAAGPQVGASGNPRGALPLTAVRPEGTAWQN